MRKILYATAACAIVGLMASTVRAQTEDPLQDPLLGFCWNTSVCTDTSANTQVTGNPPFFGFEASAGPLTGDFVLKVLVPTNLDPSPSALQYIFDVTQGGVANTSSFTSSASTLVSLTPWTSGTLEDYLGGSFSTASPNNPIGNYVGTSHGGFNNADPTANGYFVYETDLGQNTLSSPSAGSNGMPKITVDVASSGLPAGSYINGFLLNVPSFGNIATANSGALLIETPPSTSTLPPPPPVSEPLSLSIFAAGLFGLGYVRRVWKS